MTENWAAIADFPAYEMSDIGRVRRDGRVKTLRTNKFGYISVVLWCKSMSHTRLVAPLVAQAFIGLCPDGFVTCHNDGDRTNNAATNLRWDSRSANEHDKRTHGTARVLDRHLDAKLNLALVLQLRKRFKPNSRTDGIKALAREHGMSHTAMRRALNGTTWCSL